MNRPFGIFLLIVACFGFLSGCSDSLSGLVVRQAGIELIEAVLPAKHEPSFKAEVVVDLIVDGEALQIRRVVECETVAIKRRGFPKTKAKRSPTVYKVKVGAMGARLKSGGAIMMWTPYRCAHNLAKNSVGNLVRRVVPNAKDYIPFMGWTPDADRVDVLELYPTRTYFQKPNARIKLVSLSVRDAKNGANVDKPDEFEWFTSVKPGEFSTTGQRFRGVFAYVLDEKDWVGRDEKFDATLKQQKSLWALPRYVDEKTGPAWKKARILFAEKLGMPNGWSGGGRLPAQARTFGVVRLEKNSRHLRNLSIFTGGPLNRLDHLEHVLVLDWDKSGAVVVRRDAETSFFRLFRLKKHPPDNRYWRGARLPNGAVYKNPRHTNWVRGKRLLKAIVKPHPTSNRTFAHHDSSLLYDPQTKEIYWLFPIWYATRPRTYHFEDVDPFSD